MTQPNPSMWGYPQQPPSPAPARFTIHYGFALLAFFSLLGTVIPTILMFAAAEVAMTVLRQAERRLVSAAGSRFSICCGVACGR